jgi:ornithine decarboxylase
MHDAPLSTGLACGDHVYIGSAGAYTTAYASSFNGFDVPTVRCVSGASRVVNDLTPATTGPPPKWSA